MKHSYCVACGAAEDLQHHHLIPRSLGGSDDESNLVTLCRPCHGAVHSQNINASINHSVRTRAGLAAARERGVKLGTPATPEAIANATQARRASYEARLAKTEKDWLPVVLELRPQTRWEEVAAEIGARTGLLFSTEALKRAARYYVVWGRLPPSILRAAPRRCQEASRVKEASHIKAVASLFAERPDATLREIGEALEAQGVKTPRGGEKWSASSIWVAKMRAERLGLLAA